MKTIKSIYTVSILILLVILLPACSDDDDQSLLGVDTEETVPAAPANLQATQPSPSSISLTWEDHANDEQGFRIERSQSPTGGYTQCATMAVNAESHVVNGLQPSTRYYFRICAYNAAGNSSYSNVANATTLAQATNPPTAPSNLEASQATSSSVRLDWHDNSNNEEGFKIERSLSASSGFSQVGQESPGATSATVNGLNAETTYYFRVRSYNSAGNSGYSNTVSKKTLPANANIPSAPSNLQATVAVPNTINLSWQDNSNNETGFRIERSTQPSGSFAYLGTVPANQTTLQNGSLDPGTTYYYRVRAFNGDGDSPYSNVASATVPAEKSAPVLTGPHTVNTGVYFTLTWTYDWPSCTYCPSTSGYRLEESSTSASSGFSTIYDSYQTADRESPKTVAVTPRQAGTYWYRVRAFDNGWTDYSNVLQVTVVAPVSKTRFVNNTSYLIVSLKIDGYEQFPTSPLAIPSGGWYEIELSPGNHSVEAWNGFWDGSSRFKMYSWSGTFTQQSGVTGEVTFNDPTIQQLLTRFSSSGYWEGNYWYQTLPHTAAFRFYSNGSYRFYNDGSQQAQGNYSLVSRNPATFSVDFSVGDHQGTLYETFGYFTMRNGPPGFEMIQYFYTGAAAAPQQGPIDVPLNVTIRASID